MNIETNDKYCFLWSILASLHHCDNNHLNRVSIYRQIFNELKLQDFDSTNGFKCSDVLKYEKLNNLSKNIVELNSYEDQNKRRHQLVPIEISKNDSNRVIDLLLYENHYAFFKKLNVFLGDLHKIFICRRCLNSYTSEYMLMIHNPK